MDRILNAEILFLYEAKDTNPNGDPDGDNRPRMDYVGRRLLVSDVRLKRYVRDYLLEKGLDVWVRTREDGTHVDADTRLKELLEGWGGKKGELRPDLMERFLEALPDVRLFGAVLPIKAEKGEAKGGTGQFVGPVQFDWGYSLHPAEVYTASITSHFAGRTEGGKGEHGTIGKDHRVHYALIGFWGRVSAKRAEKTRLKPEDLRLLEEGLIQGLLHGATTRSKVGQTPRLYLMALWKEGFRALGDPRDGLRVRPKAGGPEAIRSVRDYVLEAGRLAQALLRHRESLAGVRLWVHPDLEVEGLDLDSLPVERLPLG